MVQGIPQELHAHWVAEAASVGRNPYEGRRLLSVPGMEAYAGVDQSGLRRFVAIRLDHVRRRTAATRFPRSSRGVVVESVEQGAGGIAFFLREQAGIPEPLFPAVMSDMLSACAQVSGDEAVRLSLERFSAWQAALSRQGPGMTALEVRGILGELLVMRDVIQPALGTAALIDTWRSPEDDHVHDFAGPNWELEVKTAIAPATSFHVNADGQLEPEAGCKMFLCTLEVEPDAEGVSMEGLVGQLLALCDPASDLHESLRNTLIRRGALTQMPGGEAAQGYRVTRMQFYEVGGAFPLVRRSSLPGGVSALRYEVSLAACTQFRTDAAAVSAVLRNRERGQ